MKITIILLCMLLGGCTKCVYGYSSACGAESAEDQKYKDEYENPNKNKNEKEKPAPSTGWH